MIIGIDGNEANISEKVGIGEYAYELLTQFHKSHPPAGGSNLKFQIYLKERPRNDMPTPTPNFSYKIVRPRKLWTRIGLPVKLFTENSRPDIFFTPTHYGPRFSPVPTAISIMDLSYIHFPQLFKKNDLYQLKNWTKLSAKKAKKIFTISEFSKNDIIKTYGVSKENVVVTYPGIKQDLGLKIKDLSMEDLYKKFGIKGEYILFVGTLQPRKNIVKLIEAFAKLKEDKLELVIVGKRGWLYEDILSAPQKFDVSERVKFLDFVSDDDLANLYKNALCFVLPSLYEGFGLPVLEAMKNGCPVLISNVSSLPEAGGDAAIYFDPRNADEISKAIKRVIEDKNLRDEMVKKGYAQVKKFSWEKTARQTLKVLEELGNVK